MVRILTVKVPAVKPTRRTTRKPGRFGQGLLRSTPAYRAPYTAEDVAWHALDLATAEDRRYDELAEEAAWQDRLDRGVVLC